MTGSLGVIAQKSGLRSQGQVLRVQVEWPRVEALIWLRVEALRWLRVEGLRWLRVKGFKWLKIEG